jgi:hypothetical protein
MSARAAGGCNAREFVRMKKPDPGFVVANSCDRTDTLHVVSTGIAWQVCVPVGSSSRATRIGIESLLWISARVCARREDEVDWRGGREERVSWRGSGLGVDIVVGEALWCAVVCLLEGCNLI